MGFGLAAVAVVAVGWLQSPPDITASEAVDAARGAFRAAGVDGARVDPRPRADAYRPAGGREALPVWRTSTRVRGGRVELWLAREDGEPVFLDDRSGDGAVQLLSDAEFNDLADHYENPATARQIRRNLALTIAAALATAIAVQWDRQRTRLQHQRRAGGPRGMSPPAVGAITTLPTRPAPPATRVPAAAANSTAADPTSALPSQPATASPTRAPARAVPLRAEPRRTDRPLRAQEIL